MPSKPAAASSDDDIVEFNVARSSLQLAKAAASKGPGSTYFPAKSFDPYDGGEKSSGYYTRSDQAVYTPTPYASDQTRSMVAYKPAGPPAGDAGRRLMVDYDKGFLELKKSLVKAQEFFDAHHMQVLRERETVAELKEDLDEKEQELEELRATMEKLAQENKELRNQAKSLVPLPEKVKDLACKLSEYHMAHQNVLRAIEGFDDDDDKAPLLSFLEDFRFPVFKEEDQAKAVSKYSRTKRAPAAHNTGGGTTGNV
jgi:hypothetical protein